MKFRPMNVLLSEGKKAPDEKAPPLRNISRLSQPKPQQRKPAKSVKNFPQTQVIDLAEQEKNSEKTRWSRAAHQAHHCCVSQRHPAFVHLTELLVRSRPL